MRTRPFYIFRNCVKRFFSAADGANIINEDMDKLTVTIHGTEKMKGEGGSRSLNVMREFQEDFDEMEGMMRTPLAKRIEVRRGVKNSLDAIE